MVDQVIDVDGIPMGWREDGTGVPVVLVHGIPTSPALWRHVIGLVPGARLLAWEMVGYGESIPQGHERDISVGQQAEYLCAWMRAVGVRSAVLVGHDLGGGVVHIAAIRDPSICRGLVLVDSIGYDSWPIPSVKAMQRLSAIVARMPLSLLRTSLRRFLFQRGHDDRAVADESFEVHFAPYARHDGARALVRQVQALDTNDTLAVQDAIPSLRGRFPAAVVWGAADQFQKLRYGHRFARDLGCELTAIDGGKHFLPEDHPVLVATAIERIVVEAREAPEPPGVYPAL